MIKKLRSKCINTKINETTFFKSSMTFRAGVPKLLGFLIPLFFEQTGKKQPHWLASLDW